MKSSSAWSTGRITPCHGRLASLEGEAPRVGAVRQIGAVRRRPAALAYGEITTNDPQRVDAELHAYVEKGKQRRAGGTAEELGEVRIVKAECTGQSEATSNRRVHRALERVLEKT